MVRIAAPDINNLSWHRWIDGPRRKTEPRGNRLTPPVPSTQYGNPDRYETDRGQ